MTPPPLPPLLPGLLVTGAGGALGALVRWWLTLLFPVAAGSFPWVTLAINVSGSALLAALPLLPVARRPLVALLLGTGVLGGYTTMSAASVDTVTLLDAGRPAAAAAYVVGTVVAAVLSVVVVRRVRSEGAA